MAIIDTSFNDLPLKLILHTEALALAEADLGATFTWDGNSRVPCTCGKQFEGKELDVTGWRTVRKVKFTYRTFFLPTGNGMPKTNDPISLQASHDGPTTSYRVQSTENCFDAWVEVMCHMTNS